MVKAIAIGRKHDDHGDCGEDGDEDTDQVFLCPQTFNLRLCADLQVWMIEMMVGMMMLVVGMMMMVVVGVMMMMVVVGMMMMMMMVGMMQTCE